MEMFDTLDERTGVAGQWKWNEPRGVFFYATAIYLFICLFRWHTQIKRHEQSLGEYMLWTIQAVLGASNVVPCQYLNMIEPTYAMAG